MNNIARWAAVAVTGLFVLMNLGAAIDPEQASWIRIAGAVLAVAGTAAAVGLAMNQPWGRTAVIGVGALNALGAVATLPTGEEGFIPGIVVGGLGVLLGALAGKPVVQNIAAPS